MEEDVSERDACKKKNTIIKRVGLQEIKFNATAFYLLTLRAAPI